MANKLLQKVLDTTTVGAEGSGILNDEQSNTFIDYMWDATTLGAEARTVRMTAPTRVIDKINVGERVVRGATEATDTGENVGPTFSKVEITTTKLRIDYELSTESLEDNIEGDDLEDTVVRVIATAAGNDVEELSIHGDVSGGDPFFGLLEGWHSRALEDGVVENYGGNAIDKGVFNTAIKAIDRKYLARRNQLKFYTGSNLIQDYLYNLTNISATPEDIAASILQGRPAAPGGAAGGTLVGASAFAFGIPVKEVPLFDEDQAGGFSGAPADGHGFVEMTFPQNRLWGVKREITVYREFKPKKDAIEYTIYTRVGTQIENADAYVVVNGIAVA